MAAVAPAARREFPFPFPCRKGNQKGRAGRKGGRGRTGRSHGLEAAVRAAGPTPDGPEARRAAPVGMAWLPTPERALPGWAAGGHLLYGYIWRIYGLYMAYIWPLHGPYMAMYGLYMAYIWRDNPIFPLLLPKKHRKSDFFRFFSPTRRRKSDFSVHFPPKSVENLIFPFIFPQKASNILFFRSFFPKASKI